jgi:hypothetical protein
MKLLASSGLLYMQKEATINYFIHTHGREMSDPLATCGPHVVSLAGSRWSLDPPARDNHLQIGRADALLFRWVRSR